MSTPQRRLRESGRRVRDDAVDLVSAVGEVSTLAVTILRKELEKRPYATLGTAAVAGWILGGGLAGRLGSRVLVAGGQILLRSAIDGIVSGRTGNGSARSREPLSEDERRSS